jgi:hypothetical protein
MTLGYRYFMGEGGVDHSCKAAFMYYEPVAF